jgi:hypothetical protein
MAEMSLLGTRRPDQMNEPEPTIVFTLYICLCLVTICLSFVIDIVDKINENNVI